MRKNNVEIISELGANRYLRIIDLGENNLHEINSKAFSKLHYLQELNVEKNYISSLAGIENLLMLQKLNANNNRLKEIDIALVYMFLN